MFEKRTEEEKPSIHVGKINTKDIFSSPKDDDQDVKFYKPTVQPKKMKIKNLFSESEENNSQALSDLEAL